MNNTVIPGDSGVVANLPIVLDSISTGTYKVKISGITLAYLNDKQQPQEMSQPDFTAGLTIAGSLRGDANNNTTVNIADVAEVAAYIYEAPTPLQPPTSLRRMPRISSLLI